MKSRKCIIAFFYLAIILRINTNASPVHLSVLMPKGEYFNTVLEGIKSELGESYSLRVILVDTIENGVSISSEVRASQGIILMDSKAITLFRELLKQDSAFAKLPKFVLMTLQVDEAVKGIPNVSGIRFEVPGYTLVTNFRAVSEMDVSKVGVFYRKRFSKLVEDGERLLAREKIRVYKECIDSDNPKLSQAEALKILNSRIESMVKKEGVQVLWMLPDNIYVNANVLKEFWLGKVKKMKLPVVVQVENLASLQINAGLFSADPDYEQLGIQSAGQILQVLEQGESSESVGLEPLISVKTVVNLEVAKEIGWKLNATRLEKINKIYKK